MIQPENIPTQPHASQEEDCELLELVKELIDENIVALKELAK